MGRENGGIVGSYVSTTRAAAGGRWSLNAAAQRSARINTQTTDVWPQGDASFSSVSLLCHCDVNLGLTAKITSTVGSDLFIGTFNTVCGISAVQAKFGPNSFFTDGATSNNLRAVQAASELTLGTGDFTIEFWHYPTSLGGNSIMDPRTTSNQVIPVLYYNSTKLTYFVSSANKISGGTTVTANAWYHIALSRVSGSTYMYLNGTQEGSTYTDSNNYVSVTNWYFGGQNIGGVGPGAPGYYDDIRITKGVGRYSGSTCTVPTAPFPDN